MFTIQQIQTAHSKVKSGADFPSYIQELKKIGLTSYEVFVADGHSNYFGAADFKISSAGKYEAFEVADTSNKIQFAADLKAHQNGKTDYLTFCSDAAKSGVEKWVVDVNAMTCIYYDKAGVEILAEVIPE